MIAFCLASLLAAGPASAPAQCGPAELGAALDRRQVGDFAGAAAALAPFESEGAQASVGLLGPWCAFYRGDAQFWGGDFAGAARSFAAARALDPGGPAAARALAREAQARYQAGELAAAVPLLEEALRARPSAELGLLLGNALEELGQSAAAIARWRRVYVEFPEHPAARVAGRKLARAGAASAVLGSADHLARSGRLLALGLGKKALASAHRALFAARAEAERSRALLAIARAHASLKDSAEAEQRALELASGAGPASVRIEAGVLAARLALARGAAQAAAARLADIAARYPAEPEAAEAAFLGAWTLFNVRDFAGCARRFTALLDERRSGPRQSEQLWYAGYCSYRSGDAAAAQRYFKELERRSAALAPQALYWLGRSAPTREEAEGRFRAAIRRAPAGWYAWLARLRLAESGSAPEPFKLSAAEPGASLPSDDRERRAELLAGLGLRRDALGEMEGATRRTADPAQALRVARLCLRLGLYERAYSVANARLWPAAFERGDPEALALLYPRAYPEAVRSASSAVGLDPYFTWAIMRRESAFDPLAQSFARAFGLMQLLSPTARKIATLAGEERPDLKALQEPERILPLATWYLADLAGRFGHAALAAAAYNGSPQAVALWVKGKVGAPLDEFVEQIPYRETRNYVKGVLGDYFTYRALWKAEDPPLPFEASVPKPRMGASF
jgi:soluble lytic murein transglycosylase